MKVPLLQLEGITVRDGEHMLLDDVDLKVDSEEIVGVCFPQAHGGKTTLLHVAAGLRQPDAGSVRLDGRRLSGEASVPPYPTMGMVFRDDGGLFPNLTVAENIALPLEYHGEEAAEERSRAIMESMGIQGISERFPWELTRERMRLASLARALVYRPRIVLIDDFFAGADESAFERSREAIARTNEEHHTAFLLIVEPELRWERMRRETIDRGRVV